MTFEVELNVACLKNLTRIQTQRVVMELNGNHHSQSIFVNGSRSKIWENKSFNGQLKLVMIFQS